MADPMPRSSKLPWMIAGCSCSLVLLLGFLLVVPTVGTLAAIAVPNFLVSQHRTKRAEVPSNVDGIKTAELAYDAAFDHFVAAPPAPRPVSALSKEAAPWTAGTAFETLGWAPYGPVRGVYWVETRGQDFVVHGMVDLDGDGVPAHYTATKSINATMITGNDTY